MKLFTGNKNPPFALDVALEGSILSYSVRPIMQREFVGNPNSTHSNGGKYFDEKLITEWRGDFGVFGEPIYKRSIDMLTLQQHPEFADHASFMLYAPVGLMERYKTPEGFYAQTPNLYVATLASKMDAQAYHASILQTHPLGHILIPFKSSPIGEWSLGFNVFEPALIKSSPNIDVIPAITLAMVREEVLPVVRFVGDSTVEALPGDEVVINFRLETPQGEPITDRNAEVFLEATAGYLVGRRIKTVGGQGSTSFRPDGMVAGENAKIKVGFKYFSGTDDLMVNVL